MARRYCPCVPGLNFKDKVSFYHLLVDLNKLKEQGITELKEIGMQFSLIDEDTGLQS